MSDWYAPNQQAVRGDESGPEEEGEGGTPPIEGTGGDAAASNGETADQPDLDAMTKAELLELAQSRGITPANNDMTKDELKAAIEAG
jgi:hypothetical protein